MPVDSKRSDAAATPSRYRRLSERFDPRSPFVGKVDLVCRHWLSEDPSVVGYRLQPAGGAQCIPECNLIGGKHGAAQGLLQSLDRAHCPEAVAPGQYGLCVRRHFRANPIVEPPGILVMLTLGSPVAGAL
jgi:hypothetical protein